MTIKQQPNALIRPSRRSFLGLAGLALMGAGLSGCTYRKESYRYKLTLSLNTPDGVKTGSVVNEFTQAEAYDILFGHVFPYFHRGQALFVDMGPGRKPLIALMAFVNLVVRFMPTFNPSEWHFDRVDWGGFGPTEIFYNHLGKSKVGISEFSDIENYKATHAHIDLKLEELPALITFDDINDPLTVRAIDPFHLEDAFGPGVSWNAMTIDIVDDNSTFFFNLEAKLPWYNRMLELQKQSDAKSQGSISLDGASIHYAKGTLANNVMLYNFANRRD